MKTCKCLLGMTLFFSVMICGMVSAANKVIEWKFDGNLSDTSGNGLDGTALGTPTYDTGVSGQAMVSSGDDAAIRTGISTSLLPVLGSDSWSVNVWLYPTEMPQDWRIVWCLGQTPASGTLLNSRALYSSGYATGLGKITFIGEQPTGAVYTVSSIPWDINQWQMLTTTYDGSIVRIYRNSILIAMREQTFADAPGEVRIPSNPWNPSNLFIGKFDEFTVWRGALTQEEILNMVIPGFFPEVKLIEQVVYYKMEDAATSVMPDHSGKANDGEPKGYTSPITNWLADGIHSDALLFDGAQEIVPPVSVSQPVNYTVSFWLKSSEQPYTSAFYSEKQVTDPGAGYGRGTQFFIRANNKILQILSKERDFNELFNIQYDASAYLDGVTWNHLAVVADGESAQARLYINGQLLASDDYKRSSHKTTGLNVSVGYSWPDDDYIGQWGPTYVDEVKIWKGALTQAQIQATAARSNFVNDLKVDLSDFTFAADDWMLNYQASPGEIYVADDMEGSLAQWTVQNGANGGTGTISQTANAYAGNSALRWNYQLPATGTDPNNYTSIRYDFGQTKDLSMYDEINLWLYRHTGNTPEDIVYLKFFNDVNDVPQAEAWITGDDCVVDPNDQWAKWSIDPNSLLGAYGAGTADEHDLVSIRYILIGTGSSDRTDARTGTIDMDQLTFIAYPVCSGRPGADLNWDCKMDIQDILYLVDEWLLGIE